MNLQLIKIDLSIWTKRTPQQDEKSNAVPMTTNNTTPHLDDEITTKEIN
jgi:hypothetical protein